LIEVFATFPELDTADKALTTADAKAIVLKLGGSGVDVTRAWFRLSIAVALADKALWGFVLIPVLPADYKYRYRKSFANCLASAVPLKCL